MKTNHSNIKKSKFFLDKGHCVAIPTETVYGLAANAYSDSAVKKIYKLKKRPKYNPSIVHYSNLEQLKNDCVLNKNFFVLYKKFCPGPITFILKLKKNSKISKNVTNNKKTLAVRFPKHTKTRKLLSLLISLASSCRKKLILSSPSISTTPICDTSNMPTLCLTGKCSDLTPSY